MTEPVRVLHVITGLGAGGAEMFLMNTYRNVDHEKLVFDFLLQSDTNLYAEELASYGSRIYRIPPYYRNLIGNHRQLKEILRNGGFQAVHVHANGLFYITPILYAKKLGIPCRIIHSHSDFIYHRAATFYHELNKRRIRRSATHFFACSEKAGKWMFNDGFTVIPNAIDLDAFAFQAEERRSFRQQWNADDDTLVIGQVGRLTEPKNHGFSLKVFAKITQKRPNSLLVLVGDGALRTTIETEARSLNIHDKVLILGIRNDVNDLMSAFDIFLFPSTYEGLGIVGIEAQDNGLPVFCSQAIPEEALVGENIYRLSLDSGPDNWAKTILKAKLTRVDNREALRKSGFDIRYEAKKLQEFYLSEDKRD